MVHLFNAKTVDATAGMVVRMIGFNGTDVLREVRQSESLMTDTETQLLPGVRVDSGGYTVYRIAV